MAPPPPPPPSDAMPMMPADPHMVTPPPKHKTPYGYKRHGPSFSKTATSSPATSHASSCASPSQFLKTRSAGDVTSPRVRACRMDPYPRYSPRKRLSADFSDGTYSGESCAESPRSEKGGWRIHAAVQGPFLTGPLAEDFTARLEELRSPRGKKTDEPDFDSTGLLLFPVVPDFVAPAITPEVFQASIQPAPAVQPQPEPDHSAVAQQTDASYYPQNTDQYYADATWDAAAQQQQEQYYYGEQQQYSAEQQYYYNNGYDQQQYDQAAYSNGEYNYQQSYEQYPAAVTEQPAVQASEYFDVMSPQNAEAFPPLPSQNAATPEVETPQEIIKEEPAEPVRRPRAPSYAEIVSGAAHAAPAVTEPEAPKPAAKATFASFDQLSDGIAESMSRILAKSNGNRTHAEVEFACLVRRIQTQLKLMGRVSNSLHLKQMKTMHKLQKSEIEKLSIESSNMELMARVKKYEQEQEELKKQLAVSLEAKDVRLRDAVDQLSAKIDSLKNSPLASEIDAIRKCSSPEDLEKRVEEIGQVIDYLVESKTSSKSSASSSKFEPRRQSVGSWKALALYALVVWAASLCGVWVGVKYAGTVTQSPVVPTPVAEQVVMHTPVVSVDEPVVELAPAFVEDVVVESTNSAEVMEEAVVEVEVPALMDFVEPVVEPLGVSDEVIIPTETVAAEVTVESEVVSNPTEVVEEVVAPAETAVADAEPALVFTFEQLPRSSPSCFSCPSDHSTMASYFCDMLSEVMTANSMAADEPFVVQEEAQDVEATVVEPVVEFTAVSDNWNSAVLPAEETVETVEAVEDVVVTADEVVVSEELAVETVADVAVTPDVVESVPVYTSSRRSTTNVMSSPLTHALYVWCPSLFEMHTEEKDAAAGPLSDLARALTSLSSQILSEHTPSTIEEVIEELAVATFETAEEVIEELEVATVEEVIEEPEAVTVATVEEVIEEPEAVNVATVEEVVEEHEVATFEVLDDVVEEPEVAAVEPEVTAVEAIEAVEQSVVEPVSEVEASAVVEVVEAETDVETEATTQAAEDVQVAVPSNRWATEQFLINVGVLSGTAEIVDPEEAVIVEETDSIVEDVSPALEVTEVVEEVLETPADAVVEEVLPAVDFAEVNLGPTVETVADEVAAPVTAEAVEDISTCPLERCPLFEEVAVDEAKFTNASLVIAEPTFQIVEESVAADEEAEETVGTSPALDLKSLLLTSL